MLAGQSADGRRNHAKDDMGPFHGDMSPVPVGISARSNAVSPDDAYGEIGKAGGEQKPTDPSDVSPHGGTIALWISASATKSRSSPHPARDLAVPSPRNSHARARAS